MRRPIPLQSRTISMCLDIGNTLITTHTGLHAMGELRKNKTRKEIHNSMENIKITFSDWLNNETPDTSLNVDAGLMPHFYVDHITKADWQLMYDYQEEAYQLLVNYISAMEEISFLSDISKAPDEQAAINNKVNELKSQFRGLSEQDQKNILQGEYNPVGLIPDICKKIHEIARAYPIEDFKDAYKRDNYLEHLFKDAEYKDVTWFFAKCRNINQTVSGAIDYNTMLLLKQSESKPIGNTNTLIKEFAEEFSAGTKYTADEIYSYMCQWVIVKGLGNPRAKAKKRTPFKEMPADGTLKNWEKKWESFLASRTGK